MTLSTRSSPLYWFSNLIPRLCISAVSVLLPVARAFPLPPPQWRGGGRRHRKVRGVGTLTLSAVLDEVIDDGEVCPVLWHVVWHARLCLRLLLSFGGSLRWQSEGRTRRSGVRGRPADKAICPLQTTSEWARGSVSCTYTCTLAGR